MKANCAKKTCNNKAVITTPLMKYFCSLECMSSYGADTVRRDRSKEERREKNKLVKLHRADKKAFNEKDLSWQHKTCKPAFNKSRVMEELKWFADRNLEPTCISCNKPNMDWCCGHYKTVGSAGGMRYDRKNTYLQCNKYCNMSLSGNISGNTSTRGYLQGLKERFGFAEGQDIIDYCMTQQGIAKKWTCEEVQEIKETSLRIQKLLK